MSRHMRHMCLILAFGSFVLTTFWSPEVHGGSRQGAIGPLSTMTGWNGGGQGLSGEDDDAPSYTGEDDDAPSTAPTAIGDDIEVPTVVVTKTVAQPKAGRASVQWRRLDLGGSWGSVLRVIFPYSRN
jgi:hypothetical protein